MTVWGKQLVFESKISGKRVRITANAKLSGGDFLPDDREEDAKTGVLCFIKGIMEGHGITNLRGIQSALRKHQYGELVVPMCKKSPSSKGALICWKPGSLHIEED